MNNSPAARADKSSQQYKNWYEDRQKMENTLSDNESSRNIFGVTAGVFAVGGVLTFFF